MLNKVIHFFYSLYNHYPCGRTSKDKYLCCCRKVNWFNSYLSEDKKEIRCRFCNSIKVLSNHKINLKNIYNWDDEN